MSARFRLVRAASALLFVSAGLLPLHARADEQQLVVTGSRSGYTDISLTEPMELVPTGIQVSSRSRYVAVVIESLDTSSGRRLFAVVSVPGVSEDVQILPTTRLEPGRVRVRLMTEQRTTVSIRVSRGGRTVRPSKALRVSTASGRTALAAGPSGALIQLRNAVPARAAALMVYGAPGAAVEDIAACATTRQSCRAVSLPHPLPAADVALPFVPNLNGGDGLVWIAPVATSRSGLFSVRGVRAESAILRGFVVTYSR